MFRLAPEKIKEGILHSDREVRDAAICYFAHSYSLDPAIMGLAIQAIDQYGLAAFTSYSFMSLLVQTSETTAWIVQEINRATTGMGEQESHYLETLQKALQCCNVDVLRQHLNTIQSLQKLGDDSRRIIVDRIALASWTADELWADLNRFCQDHENDDQLEAEDNEHGSLLVSALATHGEQFAEQVLDQLKNRDECTGWLEVFLVRLAGEIKLDRAIPVLAELLKDSDTFACQEAHTALEKIGTDAVVEELVRRYLHGEWGIRLSVACILEKIHTDLSMQTCLDLLAHEEDEMLRGMLLQAILMNFCELGIEPARQHVLTTPKSPELLEVRTALLVACKLSGETFPEFDAWKEDAKHDVEFRRQAYQERYLGVDLSDLDEDAPAGTNLENEEESVPITRRRGRIGRNDPCPCGSGKKFKKCCYGKKQSDDTDAGHAESISGYRSDTTKFPIGTVASYGPDDHITTKIVAAVIQREHAEPILERWVGTDIGINPKVRRQMGAFFDRHHVKSIVTTDGILGCPHEEGMDFPHGEDCPFCPFWAGKQGSAQRDD